MAKVRLLKLALGLLFFCFANPQLYAQELADTVKKMKSPASGFVDLNAYYDTRNSFDLTLNLQANLSKRFQYFTFYNFYGSNPSAEANSYYSEHHFSYRMSEKLPFDLLAQWMTMSGVKNDAFRLGFKWRVADTRGLQKVFTRIGLTYNIGFHVYQFDENESRTPWLAQIEHFYRLSFFKNRVYISGFADQDVYYTGSKPFQFVTEHQLGVNVIKGLYIVAEYRANQYLSVKPNGLGLGIEYFIKF